jgi:hypothetical protein
MTPAEIIRAIESKNRVIKREAQQRASYDYILASLICKGVSITLGSKESFPRITEAYPGLFDAEAQAKEEEIKQQKMNLSALRFKQFAQSYNDNYKKGGAR